MSKASPTLISVSLTRRTLFTGAALAIPAAATCVASPAFAERAALVLSALNFDR